MQPENSTESQLSPAVPEKTHAGPIAPVWHTIILIAGIILLSFAGAKQMAAPQAQVNRLRTYAFTATTELAMLAWVWFGLRLRKIPFRSLFGSISGSVRSIAIDFGLAIAFWLGSLFVLANIAIIWTVAEAAIKHQALPLPGKQITPDASQQKTIHTLTLLAPTTGAEIAGWIGLCILAGIAEELIFRGYLQRQFTGWARGAVVAGIIGSALLFGTAHGYQGARNMVLLSIFGVLFSLLAVFRRSLRPGIFAHAWQDLFAGLLLSLLHSLHKV